MYYFKYLPFSAPDGAVEGTLVLMSVAVARGGRDYGLYRYEAGYGYAAVGR